MIFLLFLFGCYVLMCVWTIWMLCKAVDRWKEYAWKLERRVEQLEASEDALLHALLQAKWDATDPSNSADWWKE